MIQNKKYKTSAEKNEEIAINRAVKVKEALSEKHLTAYEDEEDMADPDIFDEYEVSQYMPTVFEEEDSLQAETSRDLAETKRNEKNLMLDDYLQKYDNPFPTDVFPEPIRAHIKDVELCLNFPREYYSAAILSTVAGAIRNNFQILFKGKLRTPAMLYLVIVGRSSINKSSPLEYALKPLFDKEIEYEQQYRRQYADYKTLKAEGVEDAVEPTCRRCLVNDITMESLKDILAVNKQGVTLYYDEFMGFLNSMNKYRSGDDMQAWLSIWSAKTMRVDRKKQMGALLEQPFVNKNGTIQTDTLIKFISSLKDQNGYNDRLLYATTSKRPKRKWNDLTVNDTFENEYHRIIKNITDIETYTNEEPKSRTLYFSENAFKRILHWQNENTELCNSMSDQQMIGIYNKLELYTLRFTLIMTVLDYSYKHTSALANDKIKMIITEQHVNSAIKITEYFRNSAKAVMGFVAQKITTGHYNPRFTKFYEKLQPEFNTHYALRVGKVLGLSEKTVYNYLKSDLIKNTGRGKYEKCYR